MSEATEASPQFPDPIIIYSDMPEESRKACFKFSLEALVQYKTEKDQAKHVKLALESWNGAMWMVIIGVSYGASVNHENSGLLMFRIGRVHFLCFQAYDEGALINTKKAAFSRSSSKTEKKDDEEGEAAAQ